MEKKLFILTQAVDRNDPVLGFFHRWIEEFAGYCDLVTVVCLREGEHALPSNVRVFSLGKERGGSRATYVYRFFMHVVGKRREYNSVFVHMNPEYVVLAGWFWRLMGRKIVLWYTHRQATTYLKVAEFFAHTILTAAPESFTLKSGKVRCVGHGIDTEAFSAVFDPRRQLGSPLKILSVGRITPIKNLTVLIEALSLLREEGIPFTAEIVGDPVVESDRLYFDALRMRVDKFSLGPYVLFTGGVPNRDMPAVYSRNDISVNLTPTGGIDKVVLESMASGILPITSNTAFKSYFGKYEPLLLFKENDPRDLVSCIKGLMAQLDHTEMRNFLRRAVEDRGSVKSLISKVVEYL